MSRKAGRAVCITIIKKPRNLAEKSWMILRLEVNCSCARTAMPLAKRPGVTEHCLRGRPVKPRRAEQ
jgi:hypothetical protein